MVIDVGSVVLIMTQRGKSLNAEKDLQRSVLSAKKDFHLIFSSM